MAAGRPGDHPLTDVLSSGLEIYGKEANEFLKKLGELLSKREINDFREQEIGFVCDRKKAHERFLEKVSWAEGRAKQSGWESNAT